MHAWECVSMCLVLATSLMGDVGLVYQYIQYCIPEVFVHLKFCAIYCILRHVTRSSV